MTPPNTWDEGKALVAPKQSVMAVGSSEAAASSAVRVLAASALPSRTKTLWIPVAAVHHHFSAVTEAFIILVFARRSDHPPTCRNKQLENPLVPPPRIIVALTSTQLPGMTHASC